MSGATAMGSSGKPWNLPVVFKPDDIVFILGGGPSVSLLPDKKRLKGKKVVAVHYSLLIVPDADVHFMADARCYWELRPQIDNFHRLKISLNIQTEKNPSVEGLSDIKIINPVKGAGLSRWQQRGRVYHNGLSGGAAIDLSVKMGAIHIVLLGFDGRISNDEEFRGSPHTREQIISGWVASPIWKKIMRDSRARCVQIVNASPDSRIPCIPLVRLKDYL